MIINLWYEVNEGFIFDFLPGWARQVWAELRYFGISSPHSSQTTRQILSKKDLGVYTGIRRIIKTYRNSNDLINTRIQLQLVTYLCAVTNQKKMLSTWIICVLSALLSFLFSPNFFLCGLGRPPLLFGGFLNKLVYEFVTCISMSKSNLK